MSALRLESALAWQRVALVLVKARQWARCLPPAPLPSLLLAALLGS
jgi:hypothetical protein